MSASHPSDAGERTPDLRTIGGPCCAHIRVTYKPIEHADGGLSDRWTCDDCSTEFQPLAARSPAPSDEPMRNADGTCSKCGVPFCEHWPYTGKPWYADTSVNIGEHAPVRSAAPILEARETEPACATCGHPPHGKCCDSCNGSGFTGTNQRCQWCNPAPIAPPDQHQDAEPTIDAEQEAMIQSYAMTPPLTVLPQTVRDASFLARLVLLQRARSRPPESSRDTPT